MGSVGDREGKRGKGGYHGVRAVFAAGERARTRDGVRVVAAAREGRRGVVEQGGKTLLVHGALPRKPLFVLHPFACSSGSTRERGGE